VTLSDFSLVFLTRSGCHLCEEAEPLVRRVAAEFGAVLEVVDIDADPDLQARYTTRVPVVLGPRDRVVGEGIIDEDDLRGAITADLRLA
jgi:thiol-disulfide isomerase/thioredoxin